MLVFRKKNIHFIPNRCCQCGTCLSVCPVKALVPKLDLKKAYKIKIDRNKCIKCRECVWACPAHMVSLEKPPEDVLKRAEKIWLLYALDKHIRKNASSGGVTRTLIINTLRSKQINAVYSLIYPEYSCNETGQLTDISNPAVGCWLHEAPPVESVPNSLYRPVLWGGNITHNAPDHGTVLLVGLPCQVKSAKKILNKNKPDLKVIVVTIFCRKQKNFGYTLYLQKNMQGKRGETSSVIYRGQGWPGKMTVLSAGNSVGENFFYPAFSWNLPGCRFCKDCLNARYSDLTVADPWSIIENSENELGQNLVMAWTKAGCELIDEARDFLAIKEISSSLAEKSLNFAEINAKAELADFYLGNDRSLKKMLMATKIRIKAVLGQFMLSLIPHNSRLMKKIREIVNFIR